LQPTAAPLLASVAIRLPWAAVAELGHSAQKASVDTCLGRKVHLRQPCNEWRVRDAENPGTFLSLIALLLLVAASAGERGGCAPSSHSGCSLGGLESFSPAGSPSGPLPHCGLTKRPRGRTSSASGRRMASPARRSTLSYFTAGPASYTARDDGHPRI